MIVPDLRIGVDIGETSTDAALVDATGRVLAVAKRERTSEPTVGASAAVAAVLDSEAAVVTRVSHVIVGTPQATEALATRTGLGSVAVVRVGAPAASGVPPLFDWPDDLREQVVGASTVIRGGSGADGRELAPLDGSALAAFLRSLAGHVQAVAITGVFASVAPRCEIEAARVARAVLPDVPIVCSHILGSIGIIERENSTVLSAALLGVAARIRAMCDALIVEHGLQAAAYVGCLDGSVASLDHALKHPAVLLGAGPVHRLTGAQHLTGLRDGLVADVGGSDTHIGVLRAGVLDEGGDTTVIGGIRTAFRLPSLLRLPLGGGSVIAATDDGVQVGPRSVGNAIRRSALTFGGKEPTLTDAAVSAGRGQVGTRKIAARLLPLLEDGLKIADDTFNRTIARARDAVQAHPLVVVGGAAFALPDSIPSVTQVVRPEHGVVSGAVGLATGQVSGCVDRIVRFGHRGRSAVLSDARDAACARAVSAGADPLLVEVRSVEEAPLPYLRDPAVRVRIVASGPVGVF